LREAMVLVKSGRSNKKNAKGGNVRRTISIFGHKG